MIARLVVQRLYEDSALIVQRVTAIIKTLKMLMSFQLVSTWNVTIVDEAPSSFVKNIEQRSKWLTMEKLSTVSKYI